MGWMGGDFPQHRNNSKLSISLWLNVKRSLRREKKNPGLSDYAYFLGTVLHQPALKDVVLDSGLFFTQWLHFVCRNLGAILYSVN